MEQLEKLMRKSLNRFSQALHFYLLIHRSGHQMLEILKQYNKQIISKVVLISNGQTNLQKLHLRLSKIQLLAIDNLTLIKLDQSSLFENTQTNFLLFMLYHMKVLITLMLKKSQLTYFERRKQMRMHMKGTMIHQESLAIATKSMKWNAF